MLSGIVLNPVVMFLSQFLEHETIQVLFTLSFLVNVASRREELSWLRITQALLRVQKNMSQTGWLKFMHEIVWQYCERNTNVNDWSNGIDMNCSSWKGECLSVLVMLLSSDMQDVVDKDVCNELTALEGGREKRIAWTSLSEDPLDSSLSLMGLFRYSVSESLMSSMPTMTTSQVLVSTVDLLTSRSRASRYLK